MRKTIASLTAASALCLAVTACQPSSPEAAGEQTSVTSTATRTVQPPSAVTVTETMTVSEQPVLADEPQTTATAATPPATTAAATGSEQGSLSPAQRNAVSMASNYLDISGFSRQGLIDQLAYEGFSDSDAAFAVDYLAPDWNAQAVRSAEQYMDISAFS